MSPKPRRRSGSSSGSSSSSSSRSSRRSKTVKHHKSTNSMLYTIASSVIIFITFTVMQLANYLYDIGKEAWFMNITFPHLFIHFPGEWMENFIVLRYTAITRRIHVPKHSRPLKFTPSISFMGGGQLWMFAIGAGHYIYENYGKALYIRFKQYTRYIKYIHMIYTLYTLYTL